MIDMPTVTAATAEATAIAEEARQDVGLPDEGDLAAVIDEDAEGVED